MSRFPIVGSAAWILNQVSLDHQMSRIVLGENAAVRARGDPPYPRTAQTAPSGNVTVLDHNILNSFLDEHAVNARVFQFEASQNDVVGFHYYVEIGKVEDIADVLRSGRWRHKMPCRRGTAFSNMERRMGSPVRQLRCCANRDLLATRASLDLDFLAIGLEPNVIERVRCQPYQ